MKLLPPYSEKKKIKILLLETGRLWPYHQEKKALSANSLTKILKEIEYGEIPSYILKKAIENGQLFHQTIQNFVETGNFFILDNISKLGGSTKLKQKINETVAFIKKNFWEVKNCIMHFTKEKFLGSEKLHYAFYKGNLLATYVDLEFEDYVVELKSNNFVVNDNFSFLLILEIQLLIQYLCTKKKIYLLWSTGKGVIFHQFTTSEPLLKILDMLIDLTQNSDLYSIETKKKIMQKIVENYSPIKLFIPNLLELH